MPDSNGKKWPLPAYEFFDDPVHGKGVRFNFALNHPDEEMARHRGRFVAWSFDGSRVLASAATIGGIHDEVNRLKLGTDDCIIERIPDDA
jgi:hypothetical protein